MEECLQILTEREGVVIRQLTEADDLVYFESFNASRPEIGVWDPGADNKHRTLEYTRQARLYPAGVLRMGIWDGDRFVGSVNATPQANGIEIGYWVVSRETARGYATLAARALSRYAAERTYRVFAEVILGNNASIRVLEKSGFRKVAEVFGRLDFELAASEPAGS